MRMRRRTTGPEPGALDLVLIETPEYGGGEVWFDGS